MAESQVLSGLVAKRGELAGEMDHHRRELQRLARRRAGSVIDEICSSLSPNRSQITLRISKRAFTMSVAKRGIDTTTRAAYKP
jgi:hypothetical protein